jgi:hypothetical protein
MTKPSYLPMIVSVSFLLAVLASFITVFWCSFFGGCKFGKYQAEVTLTDAKTHEPLANRKLTPIVSSGTPSLTNTREEGQAVMTDSEGKARLEFSRVFYSRVSIRLASESPKTKALFGFFPEKIRENTTLSDTDSPYSYADGREKGEIKLVLEVGDWSLF